MPELLPINETYARWDHTNHRRPAQQHSKQNTGTPHERLAFDKMMLEGHWAATRHVCQRTLCDHVLPAGAAPDEHIPDAENWNEVKQGQPFSLLARPRLD